MSVRFATCDTFRFFANWSPVFLMTLVSKLSTYVSFSYKPFVYLHHVMLLLKTKHRFDNFLQRSSMFTAIPAGEPANLRFRWKWRIPHCRFFLFNVWEVPLLVTKTRFKEAPQGCAGLVGGSLEVSCPPRGVGGPRPNSWPT